MSTAANLEDRGCGIAQEGTYMGRQMLIAATDDEEKAYQLARICGREGTAVGINWTFHRLLISIAISVIRLPMCVRMVLIRSGRCEWRQSTRRGGRGRLLTSIKHFPGDGVDERDQHLLTSVNELSIEEWEAGYGKLYQTLIKEGAKTVMAGHIAMPAMEEK